MQYNFSNLGHCMSLNSKLIKHMKDKNYPRLKDYICVAFDTFDPVNAKNHPCFDILNTAVKMIQDNGWSVGVGEYKDIGKQMIVVSPEKHYYHSKFNHNS